MLQATTVPQRTHFHRATTSQVHASALNGWDGLVDAADVPELHALRDTRPGDISRPSIPLAEFVRFSEKMVARRRDVSLPWAAGMRFDLATLGGALGEPVLGATRVGSALRRLVDLFVVLQDCTEMTLHRDGDMAAVSYRILDPDIWPRHHDAVFTLGIVAQIILRGQGAGATAGAWDKVEFVFEAEAHDLPGPMGKVLNAPCSFGGDTNQMRFPAALLDLALPVERPNNDLSLVNRAIVEHRRRTPLVERLAQAVWRDLNCRPIEQDRLAREIGMSARTMRRKLAEEASSFQEVLDECRMRQALFEFRTRPDLSIAEIALRLGYAEHSNFTRAFHRWSGVSPHCYRLQMAH
ncbi:helix-turn-helix domain-containing protein [Novosphingobium sp.]|uniref:AraC-like transcriptional regulator QhpR n=1 Tax=Novosphingobium sp. TaxID=1874826 RepID=UPI00334051B9